MKLATQPEMDTVAMTSSEVGDGLGASSPVAIAELFSSCYPAVLAYTRRRAPADIAEDAAMATFEVAWQRLGDIPAEPLPWLYGVARNSLANIRRSERRRLRLVRSMPEHDPSLDPSRSALAGVAARAALAKLRSEDRELLMLVAWEGLDADQAATSLGITPAAFAVRLHRARRQLETLLASPTTES